MTFLQWRSRGPTHTSNDLLIFDALAVKKSWANPCVLGYEIKVSRGDFLQDQKWPGYLAYCNMFSFVCPKDMIKQDELPEEIGLIYYYAETGALRTVRRAKHRLVDIPKELFQYIIFSKLDSDRHPFFSSNREYFEAYLEDKHDKWQLGYKVSKKIYAELEELRRFKDRIERGRDSDGKIIDQYNKLTQQLSNLGFYTSTWSDEWIEQVISSLNQQTSPHMLREINKIIRASKEVEEMIAAGAKGG